MQFAPVRSYYKATLAQLFDNEGEVRWDVEKLMKAINSNNELVAKLKKTGYKPDQKSFTANQTDIIFSHISRPILNQENMNLLKIKNCLLDRFKDKKPENMLPITQLSDAVLCDLGLTKHDLPDQNPHYRFRYNNDIYLIKKPDGFVVHDLNTFKEIDYFKSTEDFILGLLKYRN